MNKKTKSYGIIAIQPQTIEMYDIVDDFLSNIHKSLYIHNDKFCKKMIHLASFTICKETLRFLMITKKYTYGYYDFVHNKYNINNDLQVCKLLNEMTNAEIQNVMNKSYQEVWRTIHTHQKYPDRYERTFNTAVNNIKSNKYKINRSHYNTPEWEFPKGKKKGKNESDINTAKREFMEETNLLINDFHIYDNISPIVENYIGTDGIPYSYSYYIAIVKPNVEILINNTFETEKIGFYSYDNAFSNIRPYNIERKNILKCVFNDIVNWINKKYHIDIKRT